NLKSQKVEMGKRLPTPAKYPLTRPMRVSKPVPPRPQPHPACHKSPPSRHKSGPTWVRARRKPREIQQHLASFGKPHHAPRITHHAPRPPPPFPPPTPLC